MNATLATHSTASLIAGEQFTDLDLFRMFNVQLGNHNLWHEYKKQRGGVVHDFDTDAHDSRSIRASRVEKLRTAYSAIPHAQQIAPCIGGPSSSFGDASDDDS